MLYTPIRDAGSSRYCGPTAIMAVTGRPGSEVNAAIYQARGDIRNSIGRHMPIIGLKNEHLIGAMSLLGWTVAEEWTVSVKRNALTFRQFLTERGHDGPFIVNVTGHYIAVSQGELCDANTAQFPIEIERYLTKGRKRAYRDSWIKKWWKFNTENTE